MAPKKKCFNGFLVFMTETQEALAKKGIKMTMSDMSGYCKQDWEQMSDEKKEMYKAKGKKMKREGDVIKYTSIGEKVEDIKQQAIDNKSLTDAMYLYIEELVNVHPFSCYLSSQTFILIHINSYSCEKERFYFPAEITLAEFSLQKGLIRISHQLVGFDKARTKAPPAPIADINSHAQHYHLISTFSKLSLNYTNILLKIIGFIMGKDVDETVLSDSTLDLPPIYTAHCSTGNELMTTTSSLYQLYQSAVKVAYKDNFNCFLRVYHLDKLFMEMKNLSYKTKNPNTMEKAIPSVAMATEILSVDVFSTIKSVGCNFHEKHEHAHVCSNYYVCKWIYIMSTHCCQYFDIKLIPGCHYDFDLSSTETPVEEVIENLNISTEFDCLGDSNSMKKITQDLSSSSFPSFEGGFSSAVAQPVWKRPPNKSTHKMCTTILNKGNNFPPLSGLQKVVPEETPVTKMNNWQKSAGLGRGQVLNIPRQSNKSSKLSKGRGFDTSGK